MTSEQTQSIQEEASKEAPADKVMRASKLSEQGKHAEALALLEPMLEGNPDFIPLINAYGVVLAQAGDLDGARKQLERAVELEPKMVQGLVNLGNVEKIAGRFSEAAKYYRKAIELNPANPDGHYNLAVVQAELGQDDAAAESLRLALLFRPTHAEAHNNLGHLHMRRNELEKAAFHLRQAQVWMPSLYQARNNLISVLYQLGEYTEAEMLVSDQLAINPDNTTILRAHAVGLSYMGRHKEAHATLERVLELEPEASDVLGNLGTIKQFLGDYAGAIDCIQQAMRLRGTNLAACYANLGSVFSAKGDVRGAAEHFRHALMLAPGEWPLLSNLAVAQVRAGDVALGLQSLRQAIVLAPDKPELQSNLIFSLHYDHTSSADARYAEARVWNERFALPLKDKQQALPHATDPNRKLRLGFVSADFRDHAVAKLLEPVLRELDKGQFEIVCYAANNQADEVTARLRAHATHWRNIVPLIPEVLADRIRQDAIDILFDLSVHTQGSRLKVFALKPAPIQISWLGFFATTGLDAMDWRISDAQMDPIGQTEQWHSEKLLRLPSAFCFQPPTGASAIAPLPLLQNGHLTFGAFTHFSRANSKVLDTWAEMLLEDFPDAKLLVYSGESADNTAAIDRIYRLFALREVPRERVTVFGKKPLPEFLELLKQVDIALDTFPYPGGVTSLLTLWMGLPVLTLAGPSSFERAGASILNALDLPDWIATGTADYRRRARQLAGDTAKLAATRLGMRDRFSRSTLGDAKAFTHEFEAALRTIWREHVAQHAGTDQSSTHPA